ncbi:DUF2865 domain-containing protein [Salinarimonas rosea]|uniref:DUF2865 domain-containing protein n=1 Tax=Salinarimonas rosea TaxID=552063 RepID=UPI00040891CF|nr:DUF2865 domain-containing protein [Salinarimonas rosea]
MTGSALVRAHRARLTAQAPTPAEASPPRAGRRVLLALGLAGAMVLAGAGVVAGPDALAFFRADRAAGNGVALFGRPDGPAATDLARRAAVVAPARLSIEPPAPRTAAAPAPAPARFSFCVRTCDGYFFPLGDLRTARDLSLHEEACAAACPAAQTALFAATGSRDIADARALAGGAPYTDLPRAFAHRETRVAGCGCAQPERSAAERLAAGDRTLRPGDVIVTADGARVVGRDGALPDVEAPGAAPRALRTMVAATLGPRHAATWRAYAASRPDAARAAPTRTASIPNVSLPVAEARAIAVAMLPPPRPHGLHAAPVAAPSAAPAAAPAPAGFAIVAGVLPPPRPVFEESDPVGAIARVAPVRAPAMRQVARVGGFTQLN